jgi:hypothetical protein
MAREKITDLDKGIEAFILALYNYLNNRAINEGVSFDTYIDDKIAIKARRFNSILNKLGDEASDIEDHADAYRRAKDGGR